jgi:hypothetical protein
MADTLIRLNPEFPMCWEDQQTLRFGFDRAVARVVDPSASAQRLISALAIGIRSTQLTRTLRRIGSNRMEWSLLAEALGEALVYAPVSSGETVASRLRIGVIGPGGGSAIATTSTTGRLIDSLARAGFAAEPFIATASDYGLVIAIERFLEPLCAARLAATGLPQLGIRFGDRGIAIGPLVGGDGRPCLGCVTLHDIDRDPALPVISAQLLDRSPASETVASTEASAALAASFIRLWSAGSEMPMRTRLRLPVSAGLPFPVTKAEPVTAHPECGCAEISAMPEARPLR